MTKKRLGIRDIAKLAGVSVATVSRVINTPELTSEAVREKVSRIIEEYNYVPNITAGNLYSKNSNSFALFVYDLENPFFIALIKELHKIAFQKKCTLLICDTENSPEKEMEYFKYCEGIRTRGIIFTEGSSNSLSLEKSTQTFVFEDREISPQFSTVKSDNRKGISMAVDYLYNLDHRRIAFVGFDPEMNSGRERKEAYVDSLAEKGITPPDEYIFHGRMTPLTGVQALDYFSALKQPPTAVVCANDQIARGFILRASKMSLSVPGDFSVVGFDGCNPEFFYPAITTVQQNIPLIAQKLFECIFSENENAAPQSHMLDVSLVIGDSCRKANGASHP